MTWIILLLLGVIFIEVFVALRASQSARDLLASGSASVEVLMSKELDDAAKEKFSREQSLKFLKQTIVFTAKICVVIGCVLVVYLTIAHLEIVATPVFEKTATSWQAVLGLSVFGIGYARLRYGSRK